AVWCGVVWCGVVCCGVVWCGVLWCAVVWCGVVCCGVVCCGVLCCAGGVMQTKLRGRLLTCRPSKSSVIPLQLRIIWQLSGVSSVIFHRALQENSMTWSH